MKDLVYSTVMPIAKKWWVNLIVGLLFVSLGIWVFMTPLTSYVSLTIFFSLALATAGAFEIFASIFYRKASRYWGWYLIGGIFDLLIGGYLLFNPLTTMAIIPLMLAVWLLFRGMVAIGTSLQIRSWNHRRWSWLLVYGIATMIFAFMILINPIIGGLSIVYATALAFLMLGIFNISGAYYLNKVKKRIKSLRLI